jgi:hypothetical protein
MFTLAPATRWGYFVYPMGLVGWLVLTREPSTGAAPDRTGPGRRGGRGGAVAIGVPAQAGQQNLTAPAR